MVELRGRKPRLQPGERALRGVLSVLSEDTAYKLSRSSSGTDFRLPQLPKNSGSDAGYPQDVQEKVPIHQQRGAKSLRSTSGPSRLLGVSCACLLSFLSDDPPDPDAPPERYTTRGVAAALKRRHREAGAEGSFAAALAGQEHFITGGAMSGDAAVHVVHAWDADFRTLVECISLDCGGDLDRCYAIDLFTENLLAPTEDPVAAIQNAVAVTPHVLLVLDADAKVFSRLFVLVEALLAMEAGKLRVRCSGPQGFGSSEAALNLWEARIDAANWGLAETTRQSDSKRLRTFADKRWETGGRGIERMMAQLKIMLRREVYGQILIGAVEAGDIGAVEAALDKGAAADQKDSLGNMAEELAAFNGHADIEELLFVRRMKLVTHNKLSSFEPHKDEQVFVTLRRSNVELEEDVDDDFPNFKVQLSTRCT